MDLIPWKILAQLGREVGEGKAVVSSLPTLLRPSAPCFLGSSSECGMLHFVKPPALQVAEIVNMAVTFSVRQCWAPEL